MKLLRIRLPARISRGLLTVLMAVVLGLVAFSTLLGLHPLPGGREEESGMIKLDSLFRANGKSSSRVGSGSPSATSAPSAFPRVLVHRTTGLEQCTVVQDLVPLAYELGQQPLREPELEDRLSPVDFKSAVELVFGDLPKPRHLRYTQLTPALLPCLQPEAVILVETAKLAIFKRDLLPLITVPFTLVTGDSDDAAPAQHLDILQYAVVRHWFGMNCELDQEDPRLQGRFTCLPLGNSQWNGQREALHPVAHELGLHAHLQAGRLARRERLLLASFAVETNPVIRQPVMDVINDLPFAQAGYALDRDKQDFYRHMAQFQFVVSPHGFGLDCYRTWEALYLGCIPVVKTSTLDSSYEGLPVLILRNWAELTEERLRDAWANFSTRTFDYSPLFLGHWQRRFYGSRVQLDGSGLLRNYYSAPVAGNKDP